MTRAIEWNRKIGAYPVANTFTAEVKERILDGLDRAKRLSVAANDYEAACACRDAADILREATAATEQGESQ